MAVRTVSARVALDGEKEYKQALSELNTGNATLRSEMQKLQAEYKGNAESSEFLTKKGELLEHQILQQQDKVNTLREALQKAAQTYGEADTRTQKYAQQLNRAEAEQFNLQHDLEATNDALKGQDETMEGLGSVVDDLGSKFGIQLPDSLKTALDGMGSFSAGTVAAMAAAAAAVAALGEGIKKLYEITIEAAADVDEILAQSAISSVPAELLQQWNYAAEFIDVDAQTITGSMTKITRAMNDAKDGSGASAEAFAALGVSIRDEVSGQLRSAQDVFMDVIDALGEVENQTERDALSMALMGKSAQDLNPLINAGSDALREFGEEAEAVGYVLDESQLQKLAEVDDSYQRMQKTIEALKKQLAADFAPAAKAAMDLFSDVVKKAGEFLERSGLIENLASIFQSLIDILRTCGELLTGLPGFTTALDGLKVVLGAIAQFVALIADAADVIAGIVTLDFSRIGTAMGFGKSSGSPSHWQTVYMQQSGTYDQYREYYANKSGQSALHPNLGYDNATGQYYDLKTGNYIYGMNATGNDNWRGGLTWVGEAGPELVALPGGSQIMNAQDSRSVGGDTFYITIDAKSVKEFNDIVEMAQSARVRQRMR